MLDEKRERIEENNQTRMRRAKAWMKRVHIKDIEQEQYPMHDTIDDSAVRFVFWRIAFEALYKQAPEQNMK